MNPTLPQINLDALHSKELRLLIEGINKKVFSLLEFPELIQSIDFDKSRIEATLAVISLKTTKSDNEEESINNFILLMTAKEELPNALPHVIQEAILEGYDTVEQFIEHRFEFYEREFANYYSNLEKHGKDAVALHFVSYIVLIEPLTNTSDVYIGEVDEFGDFMERCGYDKLFIRKLYDTLPKAEAFEEFKDYNELMQHYLQLYTKEYGERKYNQILNAVLNANVVKQALGDYKCNSKPPSVRSLMEIIMSCRYFIFAKKETIQLGTVILLHLWHTMVNVHKKEADDEHLIILLSGILNKSLSLL